jgi:peptidoglycan/LPS O-acetylase OafA/YrhL
MYLYHHFARHGAVLALRAIGLEAPLALFVLCSLLTIAVASASFRLIEAPLSRWKRRLDR